MTSAHASRGGFIPHIKGAGLRRVESNEGDVYQSDLKFYNVMKVDLHRGSEIKNLDAGFFTAGKSDPFCKIILSYDKPDWEDLSGGAPHGAALTKPIPEEDAPDRQTSEVVWDQADPEWSSRYEFVLDSAQKPSHVVFEVWDKDNYSADDFIGAGVLQADWSKEAAGIKVGRGVGRR